MKLSRVLVAAVLILCLIVPQAIFAKDYAKVGKVLELSGTVQMKKGGGEKQFSVFKNMSFTQGDTFTTGRKSSLKLQVDDNKEVTVAADTKLVISELLSSIKSESGKTTLSLVGGKVKVKITKKLDGDSRFNVKTPTAIMGVMGTEFYVYYDGLGTWVGVLEGQVRIDLSNQEDGEPIFVNPDESFHMDDSGAWLVEKLDKIQEARFYDEEGMADDEEAEKHIIVYDPPVNPGSGSGGTPGGGAPSLISVDKVYEGSDKVDIKYNGNGQTLSRIMFVQYLDGGFGEKGVYVLPSTMYEVVDSQTIRLNNEYIERVQQNGQDVKQELLLEFSSGHILTVEQQYIQMPRIDWELFQNQFHKRYNESNQIVIPFDQPIEWSDEMVDGAAHIEIDGDGSPISIPFTAVVGGANYDQIIITLSEKLPLDQDYYGLTFTEGAIKSRGTDNIQRERLFESLPVVWSASRQIIYLDQVSELAIPIYPYGHTADNLSITLDYFHEDISGPITMELHESQHYDRRTLTGELFEIVLNNTLLTELEFAQSASLSIYLNDEDKDNSVDPLNIELVKTSAQYWESANSWESGVAVQLFPGVNAKPQLLKDGIWLARDGRMLQPLYMIGYTSGINGESLYITIPDGLISTVPLKFNAGIFKNEATGVQSPELWTNASGGQSTQTGPASYIYKLRDLQQHVVLNNAESIARLTYGDAEEAVPSSAYTIQTKPGQPAEAIITLKKSWLEQVLGQSGSAASLNLNIYISNSGQQEEKVVTQIFNRVI